MGDLYAVNELDRFARALHVSYKAKRKRHPASVVSSPELRQETGKGKRSFPAIDQFSALSGIALRKKQRQDNC
jgi:hypothetical protein